MEHRIDRLGRLTQLAQSAPIRDRDQIERIIRMTHEADETARQTAEIIKRMAGRLDEPRA
jgi:hypothetical protein